MKANNKPLRPIDAPLYRSWQALFMALFSKRLFVDVAKRWKGYGIFYFFLVIAISLVPFVGRLIYDFDTYFNQQILLPIKDLPLLYIQNGHLVFDQSMPYQVKNKSGAVVAIVDTNANVNDLMAQYPALTLLVTKDSLYFRAPKINIFFDEHPYDLNREIYAQQFNKNANEVFDGSSFSLSGKALRLKWLVEWSIYPILMMLIYGLALGMMLSLAFIGKLFAHIIMHYDLTFKTASRLFLVSSTGTMYLFFIAMAFNISFPGKGLFYLILLAVYFFYAVLCVKHESNQLVRQ